MRKNVKSKRMIYLIIIIVLALIAVYFLFLRGYQKPQDMVEKVLQLKETTSLKDDKLRQYFSEVYLSQPKQSENPSQITVHGLKTRQEGKSKVVTLSVTLADANGPYEAPVLDFYLEKQGPLFDRHWKITKIVELDASLANTAKDILSKKEPRQEDLDKSFVMENGPEITLKDFKKPQIKTGPQDEEKDLPTDYTFDLSWNPTGDNSQLVFSVEDDQDRQCSEVKKVNLSDFKENTTKVKLSDYHLCSQPAKIKIFSLAPYDYMVKI